MRLLRDIGASATLIAIMMVYQYFMIRMIGPDQTLYEMAESATKLNGSEHAAFYYKICVIWTPLVIYGLAFTFPVARSFRRNLVTG